MTGESNAGHGPVDFKFSKGWEARALIELKLARNGKVWDGVLTQQPKYQLAEGVQYGVFVVIAYTDDELSNTFIQKVDRAAKMSSKRHGVKIRSVVVDARKKESASKLHDSEASAELHGPANEGDRKISKCDNA